jgi:hypothetical protein
MKLLSTCGYGRSPPSGFESRVARPCRRCGRGRGVDGDKGFALIRSNILHGPCWDVARGVFLECGPEDGSVQPRRWLLDRAEEGTLLGLVNRSKVWKAWRCPWRREGASRVGERIWTLVGLGRLKRREKRLGSRVERCTRHYRPVLMLKSRGSSSQRTGSRLWGRLAWSKRESPGRLFRRQQGRRDLPASRQQRARGHGVCLTPGRDGGQDSTKLGERSLDSGHENIPRASLLSSWIHYKST